MNFPLKWIFHKHFCLRHPLLLTNTRWWIEVYDDVSEIFIKIPFSFRMWTGHRGQTPRSTNFYWKWSINREDWQNFDLWDTVFLYPFMQNLDCKKLFVNLNSGTCVHIWSYTLTFFCKCVCSAINSFTLKKNVWKYRMKCVPLKPHVVS